MDGGVEGTKLDDLRAGRGDEAAIGGAAAGGKFRFQAGFSADSGAGGGYQIAGRGEKRQARWPPFQIVLEDLAGLDFFVEERSFDDQPGAFLKLFDRYRW